MLSTFPVTLPFLLNITMKQYITAILHIREYME